MVTERAHRSYPPGYSSAAALETNGFERTGRGDHKSGLQFITHKLREQLARHCAFQ